MRSKNGSSNTARRGPVKARLLAALMATTAGTAALFPATALAQQAASQTRSFDIAAQPLPDALVLFGRQAGLEVSAESSNTRGRTTQGVSGNLAPADALSRLLTGTGLTFRWVSDRAVMIEPAPQVSGGGDGAITLGPVRVQGAGEGGVRSDPGTTEGTGSYTTRAVSTTTRLPLSIRETPQSVTVITAQVMEDKQIEDVIDVVEHTTGLSINRYESNRGSIFSRGLKIENYLIDGVQTTIDEQWSAGEITTGTAIYDRVEVLRGADGLMIGVGNPSGVINLIRKRADSDTFTGSIALEGGSWSHLGGTVDINTPLTKSGTTRVRLVADHDRRGSYVDRMKNRTSILFATVEQDIGARTLLTAGISHQDSHTDSPTWGGVPAWTVNSTNQVIPLDLGRNFNPAPDWAFWDSKYTTVFGRIEHDFGGGWKAKAGYTRGERDSETKIALYYARPIDPLTGRSFYISRGNRTFSSGFSGRYFVENVKEDINLQVNGELKLLGRTHHLVFGYDHSSEKFDADGAPGTVSQATTPSVFAFNPALPEPTFISPPNNYKNHGITQNSFYAAGRFALLKPLHLIAGVRLIDYEVVDNKVAANGFKSNDKFLPYASLVLSPFKNLSLYASYTTIFQPQNYLDADNKLLPPVEGNTYEGGIKGEFFSGRLNATLSIYRMEQANVAYRTGLVPVDPANPTGARRNAYTATNGYVSEGFEAEVSGEILPKWNVTAGYSQFKAEYTGPIDPITVFLGTAPAVSTLIPRRQFNLFTSYDLPGALNGLTIGGGVRWQSETYSHPAQAAASGVPRLSQEPYLVADLMLRYRITDKLSAQFNVSNLFDKKYFAPTDDEMQLFWQEPRNAQIRLKYQF